MSKSSNKSKLNQLFNWLESRKVVRIILTDYSK